MKKIYALAAVAALLCGLLVYQYTSNLEKAVKAAIPRTETTRVIAAAEDIPAMTVIKAEMLKVVEYPTEYLHPDAILSADEALGLVCAGDIVSGEILISGTLGTPKSMGAPLSYSVTEGMRAITIPVNTFTSLGSMIQPGDRIDLIFEQPSNMEGDDLSEAVMGLEDIRVLATGEVTQQGTGVYSYAALTLEVAEEQVMPLSRQLTRYGAYQIYITLRHRDKADPLESKLKAEDPEGEVILSEEAEALPEEDEIPLDENPTSPEAATGEESLAGPTAEAGSGPAA